MKTVYIGMSGGVDSSVAAALLKQQGFNVIGVYMKNWTSDVAGVACPWKQDLADARAAAAVIDIPFTVYDFRDDYKRHVVDEMVSGYVRGVTPNPDVLCNQKIKFDLFLKAALSQGADFVATGHYAKTENGQLQTPRDLSKDQTYFLYRVTEDALKKTIFPLHDLTKAQVRTIARERNLPTATKPDSQGICFVGEVGIRAFLKQYVASTPGPVQLVGTGKTLGEHEGALFYTTGQRHGLGIGGGKPLYVTGKDMATNTVFVTDDPTSNQLKDDSFCLIDPHWISQIPEVGRTYQVRTRYRSALVDATLQTAGDSYRVNLSRPDRAITPGQSAVVLDGDTILGGGVIA